ncbi:uncharacterized protein N7459_005856 [Penicillium hispanicum]|uniref:uncharacterized protein n=1 Tax=Penicillium hispanicum TaxID=1080232 RepID=UPI00253FAC8A|nr:uncharacterized protein N7459_005856 [Penicillium hispanicum]KAJ5579871.1 hypothetical protein N7459_005856 [Penicillium hispanicum]
MAGIVNKPLSIFRKNDSSKPLHARWGDVAISVPTDGSWNQYNNPHRSAPTRQRYGPGFVPDCSPTDPVPPLRQNKTQNEDNKSNPTGTTSISRRNSLSLSALRPGRLSVRLASRPKHLQGEVAAEREYHQPEPKAHEFAYKPIRQDYPAEVTEKSQAQAHRFRYIPTNGRYLEDIPAVSPRSQSARSYYSAHARRDSFTESVDEKERGRKHSRIHDPPSRRGSHQEDDRRSLCSSLGDGSDSSSSRRNCGLPPRRRTSTFASADRKRASSLKPMTLAMVPDPEELYE